LKTVVATRGEFPKIFPKNLKFFTDFVSEKISGFLRFFLEKSQLFPYFSSEKNLFSDFSFENLKFFPNLFSGAFFGFS
jgi:hypothetical protein